MNRVNTRGIVLTRTYYGEADRIVTFLTPDKGKVAVIAKGVRRQNSKLAGGIELFCISEISYISGRSRINTLISSRLVKYFASIVRDTERTDAAFKLINAVHRATEDITEPAYFNLTVSLLEALDNASVELSLVQVWFDAQLLRLAGHTPNLKTEKNGIKLRSGNTYDFDFEDMMFLPGGSFSTNQIKFLRLLFSENTPLGLRKISRYNLMCDILQPLIRTMLQNYIRL